MAPRTKVTAVLSCDPSWRGLAFILHVPSLEYNRSFLYDLKEFDKSKQYKHPARTTNSIQKVYDDIFEKEPRMFLVDKVIMESQHKPNMQVLSWLLIANLLPRLGKASTEYVSPLAWKKHFDIALTGSHKGNKDAAEKFVALSKKRLVASETVIDHNTADACLILNSYTETTKNHLINNIDDWSSMTEVEVGKTKLFCPKCKNQKPTGVVRFCDDSTKKNYGKHFITCWGQINYGTAQAKKCGNFKVLYENIPKIVDGFVDKTWLVEGYGTPDDEVVEVVGTKRALPPAPKAAQPPTKRAIAAAPAPKPMPGPELSNLTAAQITTIITTQLKHLSSALKAHMDSKCEEIVKAIADRDPYLNQISDVKYALDQVFAVQQGQAPEEQNQEEVQVISTPTNPLVDEQELEEISQGIY